MSSHALLAEVDKFFPNQIRRSNDPDKSCAANVGVGGLGGYPDFQIAKRLNDRDPA